MDVFVTPLKVVNDPLVRQLFLDNEDVLEELDDALLDVKVIKLCNHGLLVFEVLFVLVNQRISLINDVSDVVEDRAIVADVQRGELVGEVLVLLFLPLQFAMHVLDLNVVAFELADDQLLVLASEVEKELEIEGLYLPPKLFLDL